MAATLTTLAWILAFIALSSFVLFLIGVLVCARRCADFIHGTLENVFSESVRRPLEETSNLSLKKNKKTLKNESRAPRVP